MDKIFSLLLTTTCIAFSGVSHAAIVQYGKMHEALAQGKSEARIDVADLAKKPHLYAVGALAGLAGEVAVLDGEIITTQASSPTSIKSDSEANPTKATYLVGSYVPEWVPTQATSPLKISDLEKLIEETAAKQKLSKEKAFFFMVKGKVEAADLHVIRGACPMHARMKKIDLPESQKPFETTLKLSEVQVVGVFAKDSVGNLTHPATSIHAHVIYTDASGKKINGHLEDIKLTKGATIFTPKSN